MFRPLLVKKASRGGTEKHTLLEVAGIIGMIILMAIRSHPKAPCHWGEIIPMDGGWLPHWDEALDESTGIIEAVYFAF